MVCQDKEVTNRVRVYPAGAGYDDDPRRRLGTAAGETRLMGLSSYSGFSATRLGFAPKARWLYTRVSEVESGESIRCGATIAPARRLANWPNIRPCGVTLPRSAQLTSEAAETLWSASGGGPAASGEAAVTRDRRDRERPAVRWAVGAAVCGAVGCGRSDGLLSVATDDGRRVLCPRHARRYRR